MVGRMCCPPRSQWEYVCRAGTTTAYSWGDTISATDANWNHGADANQTEDVGRYAPNPWGFYDMHGNLFEWVADAVESYTSSPQIDPCYSGTSDSFRMYRGGSWRYGESRARSAFRGNDGGGSFHQRLAWALVSVSVCGI